MIRALAVLACPIAAVCLLVAGTASAQEVRVSVATDGTQANGPSDSPSISGDGRFVVFVSAATNLVPGDTNFRADIFLRDRDTDADGIFDEPGAVSTTRLNLGPGGVQANDVSETPRITPDGRYVCFVSSATNLVATPVAPFQRQVYRLDRATGTLILVSVADVGTPGNADSREPAMSDDGDIVTFASSASTLAPGPQNPYPQIFLREIGAGRTTRLTPAPPAVPLYYTKPTISADGQRVFFEGYRVTQGTDPSVASIYDRQTGTRRDLDEPTRSNGILAPDGLHAILLRSGTRRTPVDLGPETSDFMTTGGDALAVSRDGRYTLTTYGLWHDADFNTSFPIAPALTGGALDRTGRWAAAASTQPVLPQGGDTNSLSDVFVIDLPDRLDNDDDGLPDYWEQFFGQSDPNADPDGDGLTNAQEWAAGSHPNAVHRRFLAEGATGSFFATDISLANPDVNQLNRVTIVVTFDTSDGRTVRRTTSLEGNASTVIHAGAIPGLEAADFSITIESDRPIAASRTMTWDTRPGYVANRGYGSHMETAIPAPSPSWIFAEGSTVLGFDLFYLLQNPQATTTHATVRFLLPDGRVVTRTYDLKPKSRTTIYVNQIAGLDETDVSAAISADAPIVAERAMYRSLPGQPFALGHEAIGVTTPAPVWFLAEGATGPFFDVYVLMANPGDTAAAIEARFARPDGSAITRQYMVGPHSRFSVFVDAIAGLENTPVATTITATNGVPIVVERAMYWPGGFFDYYEGHVSAGSTVSASKWVMTGGENGGRYNSQTFVLLANTSGTALPVTLDILGFGFDNRLDLTLPPNSRTTVPVRPVTPGATTFAVRVAADQPMLVVEGSVYRTIDGVIWSAGGNALATPLP